MAVRIAGSQRGDYAVLRGCWNAALGNRPRVPRRAGGGQVSIIESMRGLIEQELKDCRRSKRIAQKACLREAVEYWEGNIRALLFVKTLLPKKRKP